MLNKKGPLTGDSVTMKDLPIDESSVVQKEPAASRCEGTFELNGDSAQCSQSAGHEGNHSFEVPPLPEI
jgi:hypothetical protein